MKVAWNATIMRFISDAQISQPSELYTTDMSDYTNFTSDLEFLFFGRLCVVVPGLSFFCLASHSFE